jgi:hypothetical protein
MSDLLKLLEEAPFACGVAYIDGKGWELQSLTHPQRGTPDFVLRGKGEQPQPVNEAARLIWETMLKASYGEVQWQ